jgi:hypothetical protein
MGGNNAALKPHFIHAHDGGDDGCLLRFRPAFNCYQLGKKFTDHSTFPQARLCTLQDPFLFFWLGSTLHYRPSSTF